MKPDGHLTATLHVAEAGPATLLPLLEQVARTVGGPDSAPVFRPVPPHRPSAPAGGMLLHVVTRYVERQGATDRLITGAGGNWSALPGEDWVTITADERRALAEAGKQWTLPEFLGSRLLRRLYPPTENNDLATGAIHEARLTARREGDLALLSGRLMLMHPFSRADARAATARLSGYLKLDRRGVPSTFRLIAEEGVYSGQPYVAAVRDAGPVG